MVVDRAALAGTPAQDERVERRPGVHQVSPVMVLSKDQIVSHVVQTAREVFEPPRQLGERDPVRIKVERRQKLVKRLRHDPSPSFSYYPPRTILAKAGEQFKQANSFSVLFDAP